MIDLRSDTVTRPTPAMRAAMADAEVGDDVYAEDPTVRALEERVAGMFGGRHTGLFTPTGVMANQIAVRLSVPPGEELVLDADAHIVAHEDGAAAWHGGIQTRTTLSPRGLLRPEDVASLLRVGDTYTVGTRAVAVEQTHNRGGGAVYPLAQLQAIRDLTTAAGVALHCDGARIWHAHVATGTAFAEYGALFDTLSVCLSKGLGAPAGSVVLLPEDRMPEARRMRHRMGGAMRQAGILAAGGLYALDHHVERLAEDHGHARMIADRLGEEGLDVVAPETNLVLVRLPEPRPDAATVVARCREAGVLVSGFGPRLVRMVTHLDADASSCAKAAEVVAGACA
ncbi:threonine aldolase family protein [Yinghuangia soli]|uniref:Aminotransferase class I/II-fold pyridoxal phosphate-dependent enzyme n=1 Tax=Yinghuangia soli TaxID=2908204 RepID=A0AA41Q488_9ACTN|nr:GntG family PLP-dependent aldolase [Yinghuangia soli]MCF2531259.1 aminotransferase class I/II-fold pyridoxal phosphate-dependent enzyme [Yinghuangia soli]